ncbi:hypothetical protein LTR97_004497 [Elasticomyces elasticus]|uniref:HAD-like protein n=1 Tax=Elasticomyces elasticus TaxID=574655 RepID=A0AAN7WD53_9PEZI|nr:hypothetical protein LTR97_004497 [Elasticomyces elasticus]
MDGTLLEPEGLTFGQIRSATSIPEDVDLLEHIHNLPSEQQDDAFAKIRDIEREAMLKQVPQAGLVSLMEYLDEHGVAKAICTRNFEEPVAHLIANHIPGHISTFAPIVTRDFRPTKPSPAGILHIARAWGITVSPGVLHSSSMGPLLPIVMVGDSIDDITAGNEAGALTVLLRSKGKEHLEADERVDVVIRCLAELIELLKGGLESRESRHTSDHTKT